MKKHSVLAVACVCLGLVAHASAQVPAYHAIVMGISDGRTNVQVEYATGLNRWGQVIGNYGGGLSGGTHAILWTPPSANDGSIGPLNGAGSLYLIESSSGMPAGTADSSPTAINDRGQVVGWAFTPGQGDGNQRQSWMWRPTTLNSPKGILHGTQGSAVTFPLVTIPSLGTASESGQVLNNKGVIGASGIDGNALLWNPTVPNGFAGVWTYDPTYHGGGGAASINDAGQFVGSGCSFYPWVGPYLHTGPLPLVTTDLLTSPLWTPPNPQECIGSGRGINSKGHAAVTALSLSNLFLAYLYKNGAATDLSTGLGSSANALNNSDQVVGSIITDTQRAALFQGGRAIDLNTVNDSTNGLFLKNAIAINDAGQILTTALYPGAGAPTLLTPNALVIIPVQITKGPMQINRTTYSQTVTVKNLGTTTIPGTISVALDRLTGGVTLTNAKGTTFYAGPGSPYADVSSSDLAPNATTTAFTLTFSNPKLKTINYAPRVLGTTAPR